MGMDDRQRGFILCCVVLILLHRSPLPLLLYLMVIAQGLLGYGLTSVMGATLPKSLKGGITAASSAA